jgi:hypothetical protein
MRQIRSGFNVMEKKLRRMYIANAVRQAAQGVSIGTNQWMLMKDVVFILHLHQTGWERV